MKAQRLAVIFGLGIAAVAITAAGLDVKAAIKARHAYFHKIGDSMKGIVTELKAPNPSAGNIKNYAAIIDAAAPKLGDQFPAGTGIASGEKTGAKDEIWSKPADFKKAAGDFAAAAHNIDTVAQAGDLNAVKASFGDLGKTCKACHKSFRAEEHEEHKD